MATEVFKEVGQELMPKVLQALKKDWPKHFVLYQTLTVLEDYKKAGTTWKHNLYLSGDYETGVYLNKIYIKLPSSEKTFLYIYTPSSEASTLKECLQQTKLVPWKLSFSFQMIPSIFTSTIEEVFNLKGVPCYLSPDTLFWYPPEKDLPTKPLPDDVYIDFLEESFASEMDSNWPHRYPGSELLHKEHLQKNFGLGIFRKHDNKLLSSALSNHTGGIFVLSTDLESRGRGYGGLVVEHMTREIRRRGRIPFCTVIIGNKPSEKMFQNAGFEAFTNTHYIFPK